MAKALLYELGRSTSFGRLSLLGKVLWPMLLAASDDQGRGVAESDTIKWRVCPNVDEFTTKNIPDILAELVNQNMIHLYTDSCNQRLYQIVHWWGFQQMQWAQPSKYEAPDGWTDRERYTRRGQGTFTKNWDLVGGFGKQPIADLPEGNPDGISGENLPEIPIQPNLTQPNSTSTESPDGDLPEPEPPFTPPQDFAGWLKLLQESRNRPATLRCMFEALYPGRDPPDYGYLGKIAKKVSGAGRLAELLWQHSAKPPTGDVLAYILQSENGRKKRASGGSKEPFGGLKALMKEGFTDGDT